MISLFRDFTKSWIFTLLMGLLIASFAVFGLRDVFSNGGTSNVVTAGKRFVSVAEFKQVFDDQKQRWTQEHNGQSYSNEEFVQQGAHLTMLEGLADQTALSAWFEDQGIKPSNKLVVEQIAQIPAFSSSVTGKFDKVTYLNVLQHNSKDQKTFEREVLDELSNKQFGTAAFAGFKVPRIYTAAEGAFSTQTRDFSYFVVSPNSVPAPPMPTEAEITAFYKEKASILTIPEMRKASVVLLSTQQFEPGIQVSDEDLHKAYQSRLDTLRTPEGRSFIQVTAPDMKAANAISAALRAGQSPDVVAKANKGTVLVYNNQAQAGLPDSKIAAAAFAMKTGEVSAPVQGELGIAVVKMGDIKTGSTPSFESVRPQLLTELRANAAADRLNKVSHDFADAIAAGDDFNATAQKLGVKVNPLPAMTVEGRVMTPQGWSTGQGDDYARYPAIVKTIYDLQPGATSEVEEMGNGQYYVIKLEAVKPAAAPPLEAVRAQLIGGWQQQKLAAAVSDKAQDIMDHLNKGGSFADFAASTNSKVETLKGIDRSGRSAQIKQQLPQTITGRVFTSKPGESFQVQVSGLQVLIGHVDGVHQADAAATNAMAGKVRNSITQSLAGDVIPLIRTATRKAVKTATYPKLAITALGVTPPEATDGKDEVKDKGKGKS